MKTEDKLKQLYKQAESLNEEIPGELARKIRVYAEIMQNIGRMHAAAVNDYGMAYSKRKLAYADAIANSTGKVVEREAAAEIACNPYRKQEAEAEADKERWRNAKDSTAEIINALKKQLDTLMQEYNNAGNQ